MHVRSIHDFREWICRFNAAMAAFTLAEPPEEMVAAWFTSDDERLQSWVLENLLSTAMDWAQGIEIIDVCEKLADTPREDLEDEGRPAMFSRPEPPDPEQIQHVGLYPYRMERLDAALERAFAEEWTAENKRGYLLPWLLTAPHAGYPVTVTQDQATVAATVVQWLGSPVGYEFVRRVLSGRGYRVEPPEGPRRIIHRHMDMP